MIVMLGKWIILGFSGVGFTFFWPSGCGAASPPIEEVGAAVVLEAAVDGEEGVGSRF